MMALIRGGIAQWVARLTRNVEVVGLSTIKGPRCFLELYPYCLVLVGFRNGFDRDFTVELKCQISILVKYRQNQKLPPYNLLRFANMLFCNHLIITKMMWLSS